VTRHYTQKTALYDFNVGNGARRSTIASAAAWN
jgi:hypothetical protein